MTENIWITQLDLPDELYVRFQRASEVAWDIETTGLDFTSDRIGTVQLHSPKIGSVLVQAADVPPTNLCLLLSDQRVRKVFHHAPFDLRFMLAQWSCWPQNVACTKIASKIVDPKADPKDHSLRPLLARYEGVLIDKSQQVSDWKASQLSEDQIEYAFNDVRHLLALFGTLTKTIDNLGLSDIYGKCLEFLPTRVALDVGGWPDVYLY